MPDNNQAINSSAKQREPSVVKNVATIKWPLEIAVFLSFLSAAGILVATAMDLKSDLLFLVVLATQAVALFLIAFWIICRQHQRMQQERTNDH